MKMLNLGVGPVAPGCTTGWRIPHTSVNVDHPEGNDLQTITEALKVTVGSNALGPSSGGVCASVIWFSRSPSLASTSRPSRAPAYSGPVSSLW